MVLDVLLEALVVKSHLISLHLDVTQAFAGSLLVKFALKLCVHQLNKVVLGDLLVSSTSPEVLLQHLDVLFGHFNFVLG